MSFGMSESLLPPEIAYKIEEVVPVFGPMISGAVFGGAWWIWIDALLIQGHDNKHAVPFLEYIPGIAATLALIITNCVRREDVADDAGDDEDVCRSRSLLFLAYVIGFASVCGSVAIFLDYNKHSDYGSYPGVANILLTTLITASSLILWLTRAPLYG